MHVFKKTCIEVLINPYIEAKEKSLCTEFFVFSW